jgi:hypothetical protein
MIKNSLWFPAEVSGSKVSVDFDVDGKKVGEDALTGAGIGGAVTAGVGGVLLPAAVILFAVPFAPAVGALAVGTGCVAAVGAGIGALWGVFS